MKRTFTLLVLGASLAFATTGCDYGESAEEGLRRQLAEHPTSSAPAVMIKKRNFAGDAWLATVHGYPTNLSVCEQLIEPYNENSELSTFDGEYYCEEIVR